MATTLPLSDPVLLFSIRWEESFLVVNKWTMRGGWPIHGKCSLSIIAYTTIVLQLVHAFEIQIKTLERWSDLLGWKKSEVVFSNSHPLPRASCRGKNLTYAVQCVRIKKNISVFNIIYINTEVLLLDVASWISLSTTCRVKFRPPQKQKSVGLWGCWWGQLNLYLLHVVGSSRPQNCLDGQVKMNLLKQTMNGS